MDGPVEQCPQCSAAMPVVAPYPTWCDVCSWNVTAAPELDGPETRVDRAIRRLDERTGRRLEAEFAASFDLHPRLTPARIAIYVVAILMFVVWLGVLVLAVGSIVVAVTQPNVFAALLGLILAGLAFVMRPRLGRPPKADVVARESIPQLHALVDHVAAALGTGSADRIVVDERWNASWSILGLRRVRVLTLGLPLLAALEPQQRVALIGHELAHARNGDSRHGLIVGSAWRALAELYAVLAPDPYPNDFFGDVLNVILWVVSRPVYGLLLLHARLTAHDAHRAEYLADALAADVAGTDGVVGTHEVLLLGGAYEALVGRVARQRGSGSQEWMLATVREVISSVPARERERRRRVARHERSTLDAFHPPIAARIAVLESKSAVDAAIRLDALAFAAIDAELAPLAAEIERRAVDDHRASLYA